MFAKVLSGACVGLHAVPVTVEVDISMQSLPSFTIVGLPSKSVDESKERVRAAIKNSGGTFPPHKITVNLAPADLPKDGPSYDLPIAVGILIASGQLPAGTSSSLYYGELSLDGSLLSTKGILPLALMAKTQAFTHLFLPKTNAPEACLVKDIAVYPASTLKDIFFHLSGMKLIVCMPYTPFAGVQSDSSAAFDLSDIKGQEQGKRALEISAAGGHNLSVRGVPGAGKTMLARALPGILPDLTESEALEVTKIYSVAGALASDVSVVRIRPFRSPHHTTSRVGLVGGGTRPLPGEISLAHRGVLFLDEFPEFPRSILEALRQPIEDGIITISRASGTTSYPASFVLVAASNPCPCGFLTDPNRACTCLPNQVLQYQKRISGPIIDRIDLHVELPPVSVDELTRDEQCGEPSRAVKKRVQRARNVQTKRFAGTPFTCNSDMGVREIKRFVSISGECRSLLAAAVTRMWLSARGYFRTLKVARTIADLDGETVIAPPHIAEALRYRFGGDGFA